MSLPRRALALTVAPLLVSLLAAVPATAPATAAAPAAPSSRTDGTISARGVVFDVGNISESAIPCAPRPDGRRHAIRGRLVGPTKVLDNRSRSMTINVLVHDSGTGAWFWNLKQKPAYDYAAQLARKGRTSLVIDRLGFGRSRLADGNGTCIDAQVFMLHKMVQDLYSGNYQYTGSAARRFNPPHAGQIVLQGHGTGATIAQLEVERYSDVSGLVLMAPQTTNATPLAYRTLRDQGSTCLTGSDYAAFGETAADYRRLLFRSAAPGIRRAAVSRRNATPCGEVAGIAQAVITARTGGRLDVPVLVLRAGADARNESTDPGVRSSGKVTQHVLPRTGSALVLERSAPRTRRLVVSWLNDLAREHRS